MGCDAGVVGVRDPTLPATLATCSYVAADELIEVTPSRLRLRKRTLESGMRRQQRRKEEAMAA